MFQKTSSFERDFLSLQSCGLEVNLTYVSSSDIADVLGDSMEFSWREDSAGCILFINSLELKFHFIQALGNIFFDLE